MVWAQRVGLKVAWLSARTSATTPHRAAQLGVSFAEYVRRAVERDLGRPRQKTDPSRVFALGDSGGSDVARSKDRMLGEAVAARRQRRRRARQ